MASTFTPPRLSLHSPRSSPFRRPESPSPSSPSSTIRPSTPTASPTKPRTPIQSPSKLQNVSTPLSNDASWTPKGLNHLQSFREPASTPSKQTLSASQSTAMDRMAMGGDTLAKLPPAQVREMREGFQTLDRDNDGLVNREDVLHMLANLGQESTASAASQFFPLGHPQTLSMPSFLHALSNLLAPLSSQQELLSAFAAFDDDDSGQIDVNELKDALLHTSPDAGARPMTEMEVDQILSGFTGRRAFTRGSGHGKRGEVFRYQEFITSIMGTQSENGVQNK
ncbi:MAG: hypothetical protein Q9214_002188 [Letrouitia sp. 1 TL-2023]